jgi:hypothetical protein
MVYLFKKLCLFLMLALLFIIGIYALSKYAYFPTILKASLKELYFFFLWSENSKIAFWLLVTLLPLFYLFFSLRMYSIREGYLIKGKEGNSMISRGAIVKSLVSAVRTVPSVLKVRPVIRNEHGGLNITLQTVIKLEQFVPNICERIRSRARSTLIDVLGIERITRIDVQITEVKLLHPPIAERIPKPVREPEKKPSEGGASPKSAPSSNTRTAPPSSSKENI